MQLRVVAQSKNEGNNIMPKKTAKGLVVTLNDLKILIEYLIFSPAI
jgi:hypothetical protein